LMATPNAAEAHTAMSSDTPGPVCSTPSVKGV
jgi:hypothetical protein